MITVHCKSALVESDVSLKLKKVRFIFFSNLFSSLHTVSEGKARFLKQKHDDKFLHSILTGSPALKVIPLRVTGLKEKRAMLEI